MNQCIQQDNADRWDSFTYHIDDNNAFPARADAAGPGYWNDLDLLMVGYKQLKAWEPRQSLPEYRSQYSLFAILAAPLIFSADIRGTNPPTNSWTDELAAVLLNREVIAVSQDRLGRQGRLVKTLANEVELYVRELAGGVMAIAALNRGDANTTDVAISWADVGVRSGGIRAVSDLWANTAVPFTVTGCVVAVLATHDTALLRLEPV
eukprot:m.333816 g.333816  ORF g.333816 m.333816 type:complete len:207 (+) comp27744_c0_seq4:1297-1917(+)